MKNLMFSRLFRNNSEGRSHGAVVGLSTDDYETLKCQHPPEISVSASGQKVNGYNSGSAKTLLALRRRTFSNVAKSSRSIKIRKNASLRTTLHSFPDNENNAFPITVLKCQDYPPDEVDDAPPLKSCMKVRTLEESLDRRPLSQTQEMLSWEIGSGIEEAKEEIASRDGELSSSSSAAAAEAAVGEGRGNSSKGRSKKSQVTFSSVEIREHKICLEENFFTTSEACIVPDGLALMLDWSVVRTHHVHVEEFQRMKGPVKDKDDLKLSYDERRCKLVEWDVSEAEIKRAKARQQNLLKKKRGLQGILTAVKSKMVATL